MTLAIFDLDNTLIGGDSDHTWGEFLVEKEIVDKNNYKTANDRFYEDYRRGDFDIFAYLDFSLAPFSMLKADQLQALHEEFMQQKIEPLLLPKGADLINRHKSLGHTLIIITATNRFITEPIAKRLGIPMILATEGEMIDGKFTGKVSGVPCYQEGKVTRLKEWLAQHNKNLDGSYFYSDSASDLPLLELVTYPHAVDPDNTLKIHAERRNWPIISLR